MITTISGMYRSPSGSISDAHSEAFRSLDPNLIPMMQI